MHESFLEQYRTVRQETNLSHVMKYGDTSFLNWKIGTFQVRGVCAGVCEGMADAMVRRDCAIFRESGPSKLIAVTSTRLSHT